MNEYSLAKAQLVIIRSISVISEISGWKEKRGGKVQLLIMNKSILIFCPLKDKIAPTREGRAAALVKTSRPSFVSENNEKELE